MRPKAVKNDYCGYEITWKHVFDDSFIYRHFIAWLDNYALNDEEWQVIYGRIYNLLCDQPDLVDGHSWPEINLMASV